MKRPNSKAPAPVEPDRQPSELVQPPGVTPPPARADARRNFKRLLAAADELFSEQGMDVPMDDVARRAGLGSGTLYRHFPNRDALLTALFWGRIGALCDRADELARSTEQGSALAVWLRELIGVTMRRGLAAALIESRGDEASALFRATRAALESKAQPLLERAKREGGFRNDLTSDEVVTFAHAIAMCAALQPDAEKAADRLLGLLVDGLRTR